MYQAQDLQITTLANPGTQANLFLNLVLFLPNGYFDIIRKGSSGNGFQILSRIQLRLFAHDDLEVAEAHTSSC